MDNYNIPKPTTENPNKKLSETSEFIKEVSLGDALLSAVEDRDENGFSKSIITMSIMRALNVYDDRPFLDYSEEEKELVEMLHLDNCTISDMESLEGGNAIGIIISFENADSQYVKDFKRLTEKYEDLWHDYENRGITDKAMFLSLSISPDKYDNRINLTFNIPRNYDVHYNNPYTGKTDIYMQFERENFKCIKYLMTEEQEVARKADEARMYEQFEKNNGFEEADADIDR